MIIDKNEKIIKEIKRLSLEKQEQEKNRSFAYSYVRDEICKDFGYKSYQEFYKENRILWYNLLFKKHKKINFKNMLHVGNVNNAPHKEFRLCRSDLTTHVFIEESKQIEEKASLIYAKKILKQNDNKICYIIDNKEVYNDISEYINENEISINDLEKISFSLSRDYFFSFIDYILKITNENELFEQLEYSERKYMLDYFFDNKVFESIFVNGVTKVMNISEKILSNIVIYLKSIDCQDLFEYSEIKNAIINGLEKIKENFNYDYSEQTDVHKLILNEENILLKSDNVMTTNLYVFLMKCHITELMKLTIPRKNLEKVYFLILPIQEIFRVDNFCSVCRGINYGCIFYTEAYFYNKDNSSIYNNCANSLYHTENNLYVIKSKYDKSIINVQ